MQEGSESIQQTETGEALQTQEVLETEIAEPEQPADDGGIEADEEEIDDIEPIEGESAQQTARRVFERSKAKGESEGNADKKERLRGPDGKFVKQTDSQPEQQQAQQQPGQPQQPQPQAPEAVAPPAAWNAAQKEAFNKADPVLKEALAKREKDLQSHYTRKWEEASRATQQAEAVTTHAKQYLDSNPRLRQSGFNEHNFIASLVEAHQELENPDTKWTKWLDIGKSLGLDPETEQELREIIQEGQQQDAPTWQRSQMDISQHPAYQTLQQEVNQLKSRYEQQSLQEREKVAQDFTARVQAVMDETDANGSYIYPRAHDQGFVQQVRPLMSALLQNEPGISYEDAFKRSYTALYGLPQQSQPSVRPTANNQTQNNINQRATTAAVSVRGKTASGTPSANILDEMPAEARRSARDTMAWVMSQRSRG